MIYRVGLIATLLLEAACGREVCKKYGLLPMNPVHLLHLRQR